MELGNLKHQYELLKNEYQASQRKLNSKTEALLIVTKELDECRQERDQYQLMADQLRNRYQTLKKQLQSNQDSGAALSTSGTSIALSTQLELEDLRQKLSDAEGDIKLLREKIAKQRLGIDEQATRNFAAHERENLVKELEKSNERYIQLEQDMKQLLDEKEELVTERDAYKSKYNRLNEELNSLMRGDEKHVIDIDAAIMENKYLQQRIKQMEEEHSMAMATVNKYRSIIEKKKTVGILKTPRGHLDGVLLSQNKARELLSVPSTSLHPTPQVVQELRNLAATLLEMLNDKNLALSHQRKSNKLLGSRITDLENKLRSVELSSGPNSPQGRSRSLKELFADCSHIRSLIPSTSIDNDELSDVSEHSSVDPESTTAVDNLLSAHDIDETAKSDTTEKSTDLSSQNNDERSPHLPLLADSERTNGTLGPNHQSVTDIPLLSQQKTVTFSSSNNVLQLANVSDRMHRSDKSNGHNSNSNSNQTGCSGNR